MIDLEKEDSILKTNFETQVIPATNKQIRKKLSFINVSSKESSIKDDIDLKNLSPTQIIHNTHKSNNFINISFTDSNHGNSIKLDTKENEKVNSEYNLPSTSKNNVDFYLNNILNKMPLYKNINKNENEEKDEDEGKDEDEDEDEENICNMTYTQYLSRKLELESNTLSVTSLKSDTDITSDTDIKLVTITTKFNPPSRERIINSMKTYDFLESKFNTLFFSNRIDLLKLKQKENWSNNIHKVIPFKCSLDRITSIKLWRRVRINEFYPSGSSIKSCNIKKVLAGYNTLIIHPLIHPPILKNVKTWLQAKKYLLRKNDNHEEINDNIDVLKDAEESNILKKIFIDDQDSTKSQSNSSEYLSKSNNFNSSLQKMLENPLLYKNNDTQRLGISYGQIEYSLKGYSNNIENENLQNAKSRTVVIVSFYL